MNILHISPDFNLSCGVSKYVYDLMKNYTEGNAVKIFFITNGGNALFKLKSININPHLMRFNYGIKNLLFLYQNIIELRKFCIDNKIHIIHTHHRYAELISVIVAKKLRIKTVTTAHSFVKGYKYFSFKSDKIIVVSESVKEAIINKFNVVEDKIFTSYNCLPNWEKPDNGEIIKLKDDININEEDIALLFLGRINRIKGIDLLISAFRKIKPAYPNAKLIFIGEILDNTYKQMNVKSDEDIIHLTARAEIKLFLEFCDIVLLPSREDPFPYVMLEAGIAYKPFIGSRTGGIAEFIEDGINGFLFEPEDIDDLSNKIKLVLDNPDKAKLASEKLYKKVRKYCNCDEYYKKITKVYNQLLKEL